MKSNLIVIRNDIYYETWEKYRNRYTMEDLASVFGIPIKKYYRIVAQVKELKALSKGRSKLS